MFVYKPIFTFLFAVILISSAYGTIIRQVRQAERESGTTNTNTESNDVNSVAAGGTGTTTVGETTVVGAEEHDVEEEQTFGDGIFMSLDPFKNMGDMFSGFTRMESLLNTMQERLRNLTANLPTNYDNSTEEVIELNGQRYKMQRTLVRRGDDDSSIFISVTKLVPADSRRKREVYLPFSRIVRQAAVPTPKKESSSESSEENQQNNQIAPTPTPVVL